MNQSACDHWIALSDRHATAEALDPHEHEFLSQHPLLCAACRAELTAIRALESALDDPSRLQLRPAAAPPRAAFAPELRADALLFVRRSWRRAALAFAAAAGVAVLASGAWFALDDADELAPIPAPPRVRLASVSGEVSVDRRAAAAGLELQSNQAVTVQKGRACVALGAAIVTCANESSELRVAAPSGGAQALYLSHGHVLAKLGPQPRGRTFRIDTPLGSVTAKGTVFAVEIESEWTLVRVHEGTVALRQLDGHEELLTGPAQARLGRSIERAALAPASAERDEALVRHAGVLEPNASCKLDVAASPRGACVLLDGEDMGQAPVSVLVSGGRRLAVEHPGYTAVSERLWLGQASHVVREYDLVPLPASAPEAPSASPPARARAAEPSASPAELLSRARTLRASGRYREAQAAYRRLLAAHPRSDEAQASWVSLGELELSELGNASAALRAFDTYLKSGGKLQQEARYGRIRALARLGRRSEERQAIEQFLRDYPGSVQAASLKAKLASP